MVRFAIADSLPELFDNETEVKEMLIIGKLDPERWGTRPLGKLTHDISKQLDDIYKTKPNGRVSQLASIESSH